MTSSLISLAEKIPTLWCPVMGYQKPWDHFGIKVNTIRQTERKKNPACILLKAFPDHFQIMSQLCRLLK